MMSISPMGAGSSIEDYYCNLAREDYYTKGENPLVSGMGTAVRPWG